MMPVMHDAIACFVLQHYNCLVACNSFPYIEQDWVQLPYSIFMYLKPYWYVFVGVDIVSHFLARYRTCAIAHKSLQIKSFVLETLTY
jgi:hypothetical protein